MTNKESFNYTFVHINDIDACDNTSSCTDVPTKEEIEQFLLHFFPETNGCWIIEPKQLIRSSQNKEWVEAIYTKSENDLRIIFYTKCSGSYQYYNKDRIYKNLNPYIYEEFHTYEYKEFLTEIDIKNILIPDIKNFLIKKTMLYLSSEQINFYRQNGYLILPNIVPKANLSLLKKQIGHIINETPKEEIKSIFASGENQNKVKYDYFLSSANQIKIFMENTDVNDPNDFEHNIKINKIGHALHIFDPVFSDFTHNDVFRKISYDIGVRTPVVPQSMYILKSPHIGGEVKPHQDSTFLYTEPYSCHAFWIPIEDVTKENGCLWVIPGSHKTDLVYRFKLDKQNKKTYFDPQINNKLIDELWKESDFVPVEVQKESLVLLHGSIVHKSGKNISAYPRDAYTFHVVDSETTWSEDNWIQNYPFPKL